MPTKEEVALDLKGRLISAADKKPTWAKDNPDFICPARLALASDLSQDELVKIFDEVFLERVGESRNTSDLQRVVSSEARYAVSRLPNSKGELQVLAHINLKHIFTPDGKVNPLVAEKFGLGTQAKPQEEYSLADLLGTEKTSKNNHAQQIINMVKQVALDMSELLTLPVATLVVSKDLFYKNVAGSHFIQPSARPLFDKLREAYKPLITTYTMMYIESKFQVAEQRFAYEVVIIDRDLKQGKAKSVSIKPEEVQTGDNAPSVVRF